MAERVLVEIPEALARYANGLHSVELAGDDVAAVLRSLWRRFPDLQSRVLDSRGLPYPYLPLFLNGRKLSEHDLQRAAVHNGDRLEIVALAEGG